MEDVSWPLALELSLRWVHVLAAITWIGQLFFFNFSFINFLHLMKPEMGPIVVPGLIWRVLFWFKWGAMVTFLAGLALYVWIYWWSADGFGPSPYLLTADGSLSERSWWIHIGMLLGIIMWGVVWFMITPAQNRNLPNLAKGIPPSMEDMRPVLLGGKINVILTGPVLFCMLGAPHFSSINLVFPALLALGWVVVFLVLFKGIAPKVKSPLEWGGGQGG